MKLLREEAVCALWQQAGPGWGTLKAHPSAPTLLGPDKITLPGSFSPIQDTPLLIVYPGRRTGGMGPDFRDAIVQVASRTLRGDVEVHVRGSDWQAHGHDRDCRYNEVLLHVVWLDDGGLARREDGQIGPFLELSSALLSRQGSPAAWPCQQAGLARPQAFAAHLTAAGELRLAAKMKRYSAELEQDSPDQVLYRAVSSGLGYTRNSASFRKLAGWLSWSSLAGVESIEQITALLQWGAGLHPSLDTAPDLFDSLNKIILPVLRKERVLQEQDWDLGSRPGNSPRRRIEGLAHLLWRWRQKGPWATTLTAFNGEPERTWAALVAQLRVPGYIGEERAALIAGNEVLPLALAVLASRPQLADAPALSEAALWQVFRTVPALAENEVTRAMRQQTNWAGGAGWAEQQGWHSLYERYCRDKLCQQCPLGRGGETAVIPVGNAARPN